MLTHLHLLFSLNSCPSSYIIESAEDPYFLSSYFWDYVNIALYIMIQSFVHYLLFLIHIPPSPPPQHPGRKYLLHVYYPSKKVFKFYFLAMETFFIFKVLVFHYQQTPSIILLPHNFN